MAEPVSMMKRAYHIDRGATDNMYAVDAEAAVANHPDEWAWVPFSTSARDNYRSKVQADHKKAVEEANAAGLPPPPPPAIQPDFTPTQAETRAMDDDARARERAAEIIRAAEEKERKQREEDEKVAAARALLKTPPPQPDPEARRPGRPSNAELAARAAQEKAADDKKSAEERAALQKSAADKAAAKK
jgi:hypothetical protein